MEPALYECSRCGKMLSEDNFYSNGKYSSGRKRHRNWCKRCEKQRVTRHRKTNPYTYLTADCIDCGQQFDVRIKPGSYSQVAIICEVCAAKRKGSQNENRN